MPILVRLPDPEIFPTARRCYHWCQTCRPRPAGLIGRALAMPAPANCILPPVKTDRRAGGADASVHASAPEVRATTSGRSQQRVAVRADPGIDHLKPRDRRAHRIGGGVDRRETAPAVADST